MTMQANATATIGTMTVAETLNERVCLLFSMLEYWPKDTATENIKFDFGGERGKVSINTNRGDLYKLLVDALCAYEEVTGGKVHPVNERLLEIAV